MGGGGDADAWFKAPIGFEAPAAFFHCFHKPYNATLDFTDMNFHIARGQAT